MVSIEQIIYSNCVKYERLSGIINKAFKGSKANNLNIFIDLYSILKSVYRKEVKAEQFTSITSTVINVCSHYRYFFRNFYNVETTFYLVFSYNCNEINSLLTSGYNDKFKDLLNANPMKVDLVQKNIEFLETLCPYLPNIYFIKSNYEVGVHIKDIINKTKNDNTANMIVSKDSYLYQLVDTDTIILRPKKTKDGDVSYYVSNDNVYSSIALERKSILSCYAIMDSVISSELYSWVLALSNCPERNIKSILSLPESLKTIKSLIDNGMINNNYTSFNIGENIRIISERHIVDKVYNRFKAIDLNYQLLGLKSRSEFVYNFQNLYDPENIKKINNTYFASNPIDLNRL